MFKCFKIASASFCILILSNFDHSASAECTKLITTSIEFKSALSDSNHTCSVRVQGLVGRVLRGKSEADFLSLSDDPNRKVVFLMAGDGLSQLIGLTEAQVLNQIGYPKDYVDSLKKQGTRFKLVIFQPIAAQELATWDQVLKVTEEAYPSVASKIKVRANDLKRHSLAQIQAQKPRQLAEIERSGISDRDFVDLKQLESRSGTEWEVRAFLFNVIHLNELFSGDGRTRLEDGRVGGQEYVSRNLKISDLKNAVVTDLDPHK